jgi:site-specific recombinase XerC
MDHGGSVDLDPFVREYLTTLSGKAEATIDAYRRALRDLVIWIAARPSNGGQFRPEHLTRTALDVYLAQLAARGASISHRARVKAATSGFARWLIDDKGLLRRNPARGVVLPPQPLLAPRQLTPDQR